MERVNDFSRGSILKHMLRLAVPMTVAQLITMLYNVVDRVFIGRINGPDAAGALTGVGICLPIVTLVMAFANLIGGGAAPLISIKRGRGDDEEAEKLLGAAFSMLLIAAALITVLTLIFKYPILRMLGAGDSTMPYASAYTTVYISGAVFTVVALGLNSIINAQGFGKIGMITIALGAGLNIILDPIFIFALNMGVTGAAIATVISQAVSALWTTGFLLSGRAVYKIKLSRMRHISPRRAGKILSLGLATFTMSATNAAVQSVCNKTLGKYGGDTYIGIMTILISVRDILTLPVMGFTHGTQPVLGFNYGANLHHRVKKGIKYMSAITITYTMLAWLAAALFPRFFVGIFTNSPELLSAGVRSMHIYFFGFCFMALQFCGQSVFTALDKPKQAVFFSLFRKIVIVVPLTILLPLVWQPPINGVFWAEPISNLVGGAAAFTTMYFTVYKKLN